MGGTNERKFGPVFALTGGIGSGKSLVAATFRALGIAVVDADALARDAVQPGSPALQSIEARFGKGILLATGELDRAALGRLVFADSEARDALNAIVHPWVMAAAQAAFTRYLDSGESLVCYEIPLLFETGQQDRYRPVVLVHCSPETQVKRIVLRDGINEDEARARLSSQIPLADKVAQADVLIDNEGDLEQLKSAAEQGLNRVRALCAATRA